jgi:hypothetical protein
MNSYVSGQQVTVTFQLVDADGVAITPTDADYQVIDQAGTVIEPMTNIALSGGETELQVTVSGADNTLVGTTRALRQVELYLTTASGQFSLTQAYVVETTDPLVVRINSFQTLTAAEFQATSMADLRGWSAATRSAKVAAMIEAWRTICQLNFRYSFVDDQSHIEPSFSISDLDDVTAEVWATLDPDFVEALQLAQVAEADELLGGGKSEVVRAREDGILSITVGESSQMFQSGKPIQSKVSSRAIKYLSKYLRPARVIIGRA